MKDHSRIKLNPITKEIEVEGTEQFVKKYFNKLQAMFSGSAEEKVAIKKEPKAALAKTVQKKAKVAKTPPRKTTKKVAERKPGEKRITNQASVIGLIQGSPEGTTTAELKEKTGLAESQIWNIVNSASKAGKIRKLKRGLYGAVAAGQE